MSPGIFYTEISIQSGTDQITFHYIGNERLRYNPLEHYCFLLIIAVFRNVPIPCLREYIYLELPQYKHTEQHLSCLPSLHLLTLRVLKILDWSDLLLWTVI